LLEQWPHPETSVWSTRAWTFQELLFSKRRIIFENNRIHWECWNALWLEDVLQMDGLGRFQYELNQRQSMISSSFPNSTGLAYLLRKYNNRNLTYPEDALNAFAGIMRVLCQSFKDGFLSGLLLVFFHIAVLWQPHGYAVRRVASTKVDGRTAFQFGAGRVGNASSISRIGPMRTAMLSIIRLF
jgi:hypothetical protein